jgi:hypothetical protein
MQINKLYKSQNYINKNIKDLGFKTKAENMLKKKKHNLLLLLSNPESCTHNKKFVEICYFQISLQHGYTLSQ